MANITLADLVRQARPGFKALPPGEYDAVVSAVEFRASRKGDPMYVIEFTIDGGPFNGCKCWRYVVITERSVNIAWEQLKALGANQEDVARTLEVHASDADVARVVKELLDTPCSIKTSQRDFRGSTRTEVDRISSRKVGRPVISVGATLHGSK